MKLVGIIIVLFSSTMVGVYFSDRLNKRLKELIDIKYMFEQVSVLVRYKALTVYEVIDELKCNQICKRLSFIQNFTRTEDENFENQWCRSIENSQCSLRDEDKRLLKSFGNVFGTSDIDGQLADIKVFSENFDSITSQAREEYDRKSKLYRSMGVVIGAFISIMLI